MFGATYYGMNGLGLGPDIDPVPVPDPVVTTDKPWWQKLADVVSKATQAYQQIKPALTDAQRQFQALKDSQNASSPVPTYQQYPQPNQPAKVGMSTGMKVALGVGAVAVIGGITYAVVQIRKKKKK